MIEPRPGIWRSAGKTFCGASVNNDQQISWSPGTGFQNHYILYSPGGQKLGVYCLNFSPSGQYNVWTASEENVYWGSRLVAKRDGTSMSSYISDRLQSKGNGSAFFPYGESKTGTAGDDKEQFATYTRDEKSGLDYADQRWYSASLGRFTSVDPAADGNNHYAYFGGDPANHIDPTGLFQFRSPSDQQEDPGYCSVMPEHHTCNPYPVDLRWQFPDLPPPPTPQSKLMGRDSTSKRYRSLANDAVSSLAEGCKDLFSQEKMKGKLLPGVSGHGRTVNLMDGIRNLANNAYFYSKSGAEASLSFKEIGIGNDTRFIEGTNMEGGQMVTLALFSSAAVQHYAHILVADSFNKQPLKSQHALIIHEFLHMLLNIDDSRDHSALLGALGVDDAWFATLMNGGDPLTTFIEEGCKNPYK